MGTNEEWKERIFSVTEADFEELALEIFRFQAQHCIPYKTYVELLGIDPAAVERVADIPFLPVNLFKTHTVYAAEAIGRPVEQADAVFTSSGTTGRETSRHYVADISLYEESFTRGFRYFYGESEGFSVFALLPSYLERSGSSLVWMVERLQGRNKERGGFFLYNHPELARKLVSAAENGEKVLLIGVAFALLDFAEYLQAEQPDFRLPDNAVVMETGGMKGRRREISREEMHDTLARVLGTEAIHSEYGMTELLSQAYSDGRGVFRTPPWMRVVLRDLSNPLRILETPSGGTITGGVNVIDLANLYSCSFLAVEDRGELFPGGTFRILGRMEGSQLRGCNMLVE